MSGKEGWYYTPGDRRKPSGLASLANPKIEPGTYTVVYSDKNFILTHTGLDKQTKTLLDAAIEKPLPIAFVTLTASDEAEFRNVRIARMLPAVPLSARAAEPVWDEKKKLESNHFTLPFTASANEELNFGLKADDGSYYRNPSGRMEKYRIKY